MENTKRPAQCDRALEYMRTHNGLTSLEALLNLGILSFPKRICELRQRGYYITTKWEQGTDRDGKKFRVKRYFLVEEK